MVLPRLRYMTAKAQGNKGGDALINIEQVQKTSGENKMRNMAATKERAEELAFVYWQLNVNDEAYENNLITKAMCEFARDELLKRIDRLSEARYVEAVSGLVVRDANCSPMQPR
jgi:uncharacterized protein YpiB (UPF0302 family)